jgi:hypothetical protein
MPNDESSSTRRIFRCLSTQNWSGLVFQDPFELVVEDLPSHSYFFCRRSSSLKHPTTLPAQPPNRFPCVSQSPARHSSKGSSGPLAPIPCPSTSASTNPRHRPRPASPTPSFGSTPVAPLPIATRSCISLTSTSAPTARSSRKATVSSQAWRLSRPSTPAWASWGY